MPLNKILIVSDQEGDRLFLKDYFAVRDYEVELASSGIEAVEKLTHYKPTIIILDIAASAGMDNVDCLEAVRKDHPDTEVIVLAATSDGAKMQRAKELKVSEYFVKPYSLRTLERTIRELI